MCMDMGGRLSEIVAYWRQSNRHFVQSTRYVISRREELFDAAGDQYGNVHQHARQGYAAAGNEVFGLPLRIELGLVAPQPLEVVEVLAVAEYEVADAVPGGRQGMSVETRERRHAEIEPGIPLIAAPAHELDEEEIHRSLRRRRGEAHQIHRELGARIGGPEVRESDRSSLRAHYREGEVAQVLRREVAHGKALLAGRLACEPRVRDSLQVGHQRAAAGRRDDLEGESDTVRVPVRVPQCGARGSVEREVREPHPRLLTDF